MVPKTQTEESNAKAFSVLRAGAFLFIVLAISPVRGQQPQMEELPLERCDCLPVVRVQVDGESMRFLLDTGATSALNIRRFSKDRFQRIQISSWSGTVETSARKTLIRELTIGRRQLRNLSLPAFDLEAVGRACGGRIDGFLGVDLLEHLEATIELKRFVLRIVVPDLHAAKVEGHQGRTGN